MKLIRAIGIGLALLPLGVVSARAFAAPTFAPPAPVRPHGLGYPDWAASWWRWAVGTPTPQNPVVDTTGANCAVNQPAPGVFLLAATFTGNPVQRSCTVPVGTAFVIPMFNNAFFALQTDPPEQRTEAFVRSRVTCVETGPSLSLTVDGTPLANPAGLLERSTLF